LLPPPMHSVYASFRARKSNMVSGFGGRRFIAGRSTIRETCHGREALMSLVFDLLLIAVFARYFASTRNTLNKKKPAMIRARILNPTVTPTLTGPVPDLSASCTAPGSSIDHNP